MKDIPTNTKAERITPLLTENQQRTRGAAGTGLEGWKRRWWGREAEWSCTNSPPSLSQTQSTSKVKSGENLTSRWMPSTPMPGTFPHESSQIKVQELHLIILHAFPNPVNSSSPYFQIRNSSEFSPVWNLWINLKSSFFHLPQPVVTESEVCLKPSYFPPA